MPAVHWHISILACVLLYACSDPALKPQSVAVEPGSTSEGSITMPHFIKVTISDEKVRTDPENNVPRTGIAHGDTAIWIFEGNVAEQGLAVRPKDSSPFTSFPQPNQISGQIFANRQREGMASFEYEISRAGVDFEWVDGTDGGCMKPIIPPGAAPRLER